MTTRRHFVAENGYVGLAPTMAARGDEVCLFFGGNVPYSVRSCGGHYSFIGESYVHGIMNGEALNHGTANGEKLYTLC
jgi:hypothetical protein